MDFVRFIGDVAQYANKQITAEFPIIATPTRAVLFIYFINRINSNYTAVTARDMFEA